MISMSSQSRPNQKKRDFEKDIVFWSSSGPKREREREREIFGKEEDRSTPKKKKRKKTLMPSHPQKIY